MKYSIKMGQYGSAPIYLNASAAVMFVLFFWHNGLIASILGFVLTTLLVLIHELGHAWVCRLVGAHVDSILITIFIGLCFFTHDEDADERDYMLIAWGGIFAQLIVLLIALLAFFVFTGSALMPSYPRTEGMGLDSITWLVLVGFNAAMIFVNLAPLPDFDGETALLMNPLRAARHMWVKRKTRSIN